MTELIVASNRGPLQYAMDAAGAMTAQPGGGGLIAIIRSALQGRRAIWISAALTAGDDAKALRDGVDGHSSGVRNVMLSLDRSLKDQYYNEIANRTLWFLQHRLAHLAHEEGFGFEFRDAWAGFRKVNGYFADACANTARPNSVVITADYHLSLVPAELRARRPDVRIAHFTACPWVDPEYLAILPDVPREELLSGMLAADLLEFTSRRWSRNFLACCAAAGYEVDMAERAVLVAERRVPVRELAVGVDAGELLGQIDSEEVAGHCSAIAAQFAGKALIVRVERLDPSKNALRGLSSFELLLESVPDLHGKVALLLHVYSSRTELPEYRAYGLQVIRKAEEINARFGTPEWQPCTLDRSDSPARGLATLMMADIVVVNSVSDAVNLVAKEVPVIARRSPVLILSRTAGAADDLGEGAVLVNPFDAAELADAMLAALKMQPPERMARLADLRRGATRLGPKEWLTGLLADLNGSHGSGSL
jgi:trehalose 6-phosphate synthase